MQGDEWWGYTKKNLDQLIDKGASSEIDECQRYLGGQMVGNWSRWQEKEDKENVKSNS